MAEFFPRKPKPPAAKSGGANPSGDRFPTNQELLHELRLHGAKPRKPRELQAVSRRTRDYLLVSGTGSVAIVFTMVKLMTDAEPLNVLRLVLTAVGIFCGLLWYIFYGVMSRY